jgi:hypothetical protein
VTLEQVWEHLLSLPGLNPGAMVEGRRGPPQGLKGRQRASQGPQGLPGVIMTGRLAHGEAQAEGAGRERGRPRDTLAMMPGTFPACPGGLSGLALIGRGPDRERQSKGDL